MKAKTRRILIDAMPMNQTTLIDAQKMSRAQWCVVIDIEGDKWHSPPLRENDAMAIGSFLYAVFDAMEELPFFKLDSPGWTP